MTTETQMGMINRMDSLSEIEQGRTTYQREFEGFKPKFEGIAQGYYPNTFWNFVLCIVMLFPAYIIAIIAFIFFTQWAITNGDQYSIFCFWLLLGYIALCVLIVYIGAFGRMKMERETLAERRQIQIELAKKAKLERDHAEELLLQYNKKL
jgi:hypothetical protein